jgi:hypothetical protein
MATTPLKNPAQQPLASSLSLTSPRCITAWARIMSRVAWTFRSPLSSRIRPSRFHGDRIDHGRVHSRHSSKSGQSCRIKSSQGLSICKKYCASQVAASANYWDRQPPSFKSRSWHRKGRGRDYRGAHRWGVTQVTDATPLREGPLMAHLRHA